ncbi:MAG: PAS domain S-box protein [Bacteroidales bacterium]|nr:PAS domain S-box protein [Bacteroidales bacterium]
MASENNKSPYSDPANGWDIHCHDLLEKINASVGIIRQGRFVFVNTSLCEKICYKKDEIIGHPFHSFLHPDDQQRIAAYYRDKNAGEEAPAHYEARLLSAKGELFFVDVAANAYDLIGENAFLIIMNDITRRKNVEEELRKSEQMFRSLIENQGEGIAISGTDDIFIFANPAAHNLFGLPEGDLIGRSLFDFLDDEGRQKILEENTKRKKGEKSSYELTIYTPAGQKKNILITATPQLNKEGEQISTLGIFRDMTKEYQAKQKIIESRELLEAVIFGADAGIWEWDYQTTRLTVNPHFYDIIGQNPDEVSATAIKTLFPRIHKEDKHRVLREIVNHVKGRTKHLQVQFRVQFDDNQWRWIQVRGKITRRDENENIKKISGTIVDIDNLRRSRMELEHRILFEKLLTEIIGDLVNISNTNFDQIIRNALKKTGEFLEADRIYLYQYNNTQTELTKTHQFTTPETETDSKNIPSLNVADYSWLINHLHANAFLVIPDTNTLPPEATSLKQTLKLRGTKSLLTVRLRYENRILGFMGLDSVKGYRTWHVDDINALKAIAYNFANAIEAKKNHQNLVESKNKAEESDRIKSAFLATMNHELRTPLNHILGLSDIIKASTAEQDIIEFTEMIHDSGKNLLNMIEDIFQIADMEKGLISLQLQTFRGLEFYMESKSRLEQQLKASGKEKEIKLRFSPDKILLMSYLTTDRTKLSLILHKLFNNAIKYTHTGEIEYGFKVIEKSVVRFFVRDTGIGIPTEKHQLIFELFRQGDDNLTRQFGGIGAGLAITAKVVTAMKGKIEVESIPGEGSTFSITLPMALESIKRL